MVCPITQGDHKNVADYCLEPVPYSKGSHSHTAIILDMLETWMYCKCKMSQDISAISE